MKRAVDSWERFCFERAETSTLALVRIAFGCAGARLDACTGSRPVHVLLVVRADRAATRRRGLGNPRFTSPETPRWLPCYMALLLASICTILGAGTRLATAILFVGILSFERRMPFVFNSGDAVIRNTAFFLMLAPAGAALSLDSWYRARSRFWEPQVRAVWPLRLMQLQLTVIYLAAVWAKVRGVTWNDGTAVSYALRIEDLARFPLPDFVATSPLLVNLMTYATLAVELAIPILVWNRRARPYVLAAGAALHLFIDYRIMVGFFSYAMFVLYLSFVPPERASAVITAVRMRLRRARGAAPQLASR